MNSTIESLKREPISSLPAFEKILFCTDFSEASLAAQRITVRLCKGRNVDLAVMHVSQYGPMPAVRDQDVDYVIGLMKNEHESLRSVIDEFHREGINAVPVMAEGNAASMILEEVAGRDIELVILGTQAARGLDRLFFGSTAEAVFRRAPCPVLTVGPTKHLACSPTRSRPVVFATDFDDCSLEALSYAAALAELNEAPLHVVHVLPAIVGEDSNTATTIVNNALHLLTTYVPVDGTAPCCKILEGRDVSHTVVEYAKAQDADFIVLGVRKKSALSAHLPPHRTFRIIMTAPCPVLTIAHKPSSEPPGIIG